MSFDRLQSALADWVGTRLQPEVTLLGGALPLSVAELPAVAFWFEDCSQLAAGIGNDATSVMEGALLVTSDIDLVNPVLDFEDESVLLLSMDRRRLHLPHAPLVASSGAGEPSTASDIAIDIDGAPVAFPGAFSIEAESGVLQFQDPLPATGVLHAAYSLGKWELSTEQLKGTLHVDVTGEDATEVEQLSRSLIAALRGHGVSGLRRLSPLAMTAISGGTFANSRSRRISYRFDYEYAEPRLLAGSGPIVRVQVTSQLPDLTGVEQFAVD